MKKKLVLLTATAVTSSICVGVVAFSFNNENLLARGEQTSSGITLNDKSAVTSADEGYLHQVRVKNNVFDLVGWSSQGGSLGSIKKDTYGDNYVYNGMIYNRSAINGFTQLTVKFSGGDLYYVFSDFLMENMDFNGSILTSESPVSVPNNEAYFIVYTTSTSAVNIDSVKVDYTCDHSIDNEMMYNKNSSMGYARSAAKRTVPEDSYVEIENNPQTNNNNYSTGSHGGNADSWYRFNGRFLRESEDLGTDFTFGMTIVGDYAYMVNEDRNFHYNVWPQFTCGNENDEPWVQTYIGNDNRDPLGVKSNTFTGRFYTNLDFYDSNWNVDYEHGSYMFGDPDQAKTYDGAMTLRAAYEKYNLPFWFLTFHVYLNEENDAWVDIKINGLSIYTTYIFDDYDKVNTPSIKIKTLPMHLINYGVDGTSTPDASYKGYFTYPRLID